METARTRDVTEAGGGPGAPRRRRRGVLAAALTAAVVLLGGGTFAYFHTNVLGPDRICHGWVTPDAAAAALGGGLGRVSASEDSATGCTVELTGWLPGKEKRLSLRSVREQSGFPFRKGVWEVSAGRPVQLGAAPGTYDAYGGWALVPACKGTDGAVPAVRADVTGQDAPGDADGMRRVVTSAAQALAADAGCAGPDSRSSRTLVPSAPRDTDPEKVCGIAGFRLPGVRGPQGSALREEITGSLSAGLYCDVSFAGDKEGPFARFAVVRDPAMAATLKGRAFDRVRCAGQETVLAHDLRYLDDSERAATRVPDTARLADTFGAAARGALHCG
ncbi:hypothetical protein GTW43_24795 [Streptomyces sp. SID5785]|uniref:hypothetical protein n=1 Tax=Streptomyces sp. SID5785 TaxID=2690309 RepID=UPI001361D2FC|nr:hypothetical protein [Streptomyces sp. SID5785]MZD08273.1 hypothetical protein [Streptomyces sp. SID5785]